MSRNALIRFAFFLTWLAVFPGPAGAFSFSSNGTARVVIVSNTNAVVNYQANYAVVDAMVNRGVISFTGKRNVASAWGSLVSTQDVVGIKVMSAAGSISGTRPSVVAAVVNGLIEAGIPRSHIVIWDKRTDELRAAGYYQLASLLDVRAESAMDSGYERTNFYLPDSAIVGQLNYGDLEFGQKGDAVGRKSFVTKILSHEVTKIISIAPLLSQPAAGVSGHLFSLAFGSVDNTRRFEDSPEHIAEAIPEINALPSVGDRTVLCITDALIAQYEGGASVELHYATELNQLWFSGDPVALDTMAIREINRERHDSGDIGFDPNLQIYTNAVLLQLGINDPSKIKITKAK